MLSSRKLQPSSVSRSRKLTDLERYDGESYVPLGSREVEGGGSPLVRVTGTSARVSCGRDFFFDFSFFFFLFFSLVFSIVKDDGNASIPLKKKKRKKQEAKANKTITMAL